LRVLRFHQPITVPFTKIAAESLAELGYTNIREFGGIIDWPYETE
jgi:hypothetical protein